LSSSRLDLAVRDTAGADLLVFLLPASSSDATFLARGADDFLRPPVSTSTRIMTTTIAPPIRTNCIIPPFFGNIDFGLVTPAPLFLDAIIH
jgi:hypothetical protein